MLSFLLDEQISHVVMDKLRLKRTEIRIESVLRWNGGDLRRKDDGMVLRADHADNLTLVTYDQKTIAPLLQRWGSNGHDHSGVIFIDNHSIRQDEIGRQVNALIELWDDMHAHDWINVVSYLKSDNRYEAHE